jgi:DNA-binding NarL/FixJ family response regulator
VNAIRILVADDHPIIVEGLRRFFGSVKEVEMVAFTHDLSELGASTLEDVDVLVLDVRMPGMEGTQTLQALGQQTAVLLFTLEPDSALVLELIQAGARGVVSKGAPVDVLMDGIKRVYRGETVIPDSLAEHLKQPTQSWPHLALSPREAAIFTRLIRGSSPKEVAFDLGLSSSTVYTYAERVRAKLGVQSQVELVAYAHRAGLLGH